MDFNGIIFKSLEILCFFFAGIILYRFSIRGKIKENKLTKKQAYTDPLTGIGNRHKFLYDLDKNIEKNEKFAICFTDLDGFKHINDTLGHDAGDELLKQLANMLKEGLPKECVSYRLRWR
jgi:GGDEF domain-containing protein